MCVCMCMHQIPEKVKSSYNTCTCMDFCVSVAHRDRESIFQCSLFSQTGGDVMAGKTKTETITEKCKAKVAEDRIEKDSIW